MTIWPLSRAASLSANSRNEMSDTDPAAKGETMRIARVGNLTWSLFCAAATESPIASNAATQVPTHQVPTHQVPAHQVPAHHVQVRRLGRLGAGVISSSLLRSTDPSTVPPDSIVLSARAELANGMNDAARPAV
jgi:hypothetical protein